MDFSFISRNRNNTQDDSSAGREGSSLRVNRNRNTDNPFTTTTENSENNTTVDGDTSETQTNNSTRRTVNENPFNGQQRSANTNQNTNVNFSTNLPERETPFNSNKRESDDKTDATPYCKKRRISEYREKMIERYDKIEDYIWRPDTIARRVGIDWSGTNNVESSIDMNSDKFVMDRKSASELQFIRKISGFLKRKTTAFINASMKKRSTEDQNNEDDDDKYIIYYAFKPEVASYIDLGMNRLLRMVNERQRQRIRTAQNLFDEMMQFDNSQHIAFVANYIALIMTENNFGVTNKYTTTKMIIVGSSTKEEIMRDVLLLLKDMRILRSDIAKRL